MQFVITIDGGAGTGTSSLSKNLARHLTEHFNKTVTTLNSGLLYRAAAYDWLKQGSQMGLEQSCLLCLRGPDSPVLTPEGVMLQGTLLSQEDLFTSEVSMRSSEAAKFASVRKEVDQAIIRSIQNDGSVYIADGRDMGFVLEAFDPLRFWLTVRPEVAAARRNETVEAVVARDKADSMRAASPMRKHPDALEINTSDISEQEVLEVAMNAVRGILLEPQPL